MYDAVLAALSEAENKVRCDGRGTRLEENQFRPTLPTDERFDCARRASESQPRRDADHSYPGAASPLDCFTER